MGKQRGRDYLLLRAGVWHYQRRVPADVAEFDRRRFVRVSTRASGAALALDAVLVRVPVANPAATP